MNLNISYNKFIIWHSPIRVTKKEPAFCDKEHKAWSHWNSLRTREGGGGGWPQTGKTHINNIQTIIFPVLIYCCILHSAVATSHTRVAFMINKNKNQGIKIIKPQKKIYTFRTVTASNLAIVSTCLCLSTTINHVTSLISNGFKLKSQMRRSVTPQWRWVFTFLIYIIYAGAQWKQVWSTVNYNLLSRWCGLQSLIKRKKIHQLLGVLTWFVGLLCCWRQLGSMCFVKLWIKDCVTPPAPPSIFDDATVGVNLQGCIYPKWW